VLLVQYLRAVLNCTEQPKGTASTDGLALCACCWSLWVMICICCSLAGTTAPSAAADGLQQTVLLLTYLKVDGFADGLVAGEDEGGALCVWSSTAAWSGGALGMGGAWYWFGPTDVAVSAVVGLLQLGWERCQHSHQEV
jgi:hypothetical protein